MPDIGAESATIEKATWYLAREAFPEVAQLVEEQTAEHLGNLAVRSLVEVEPVNETTLMAAIDMARLGDEASRRVVGNNVATDLVERSFKIGQTKVFLSVGEQGLEQEGRPMIDIHTNTLANTYLNTEMYQRTVNQLSNSYLFNELLPTGIFASHNALVIEPCTMDEATKRDFNFFTGTDSLSMQLLSVEGHAATLQTAFVAGKRRADSERHDMATIHAMAAEKGIELIPTSVNGMVKYVMLVPKEEYSVVEDVVADYDRVGGGTFYGQDKPQQDYHQFAQECYARNESFHDIVEQITNQLISEAHAFDTPLEAIERLDYLSERLLVRRAKTDINIDALVFGRQAAAYIEQAREFAAQGNEEAAEEAMVKAQRTANSGSCPLFKSSERSEDDPDDDAEQSSSKWMKCPHCEAKVFADPCASYISCWDCKAKVIDGKSFKGNGGSKKRREQAQQKLAQQKEAQAVLTGV